MSRSEELKFVSLESPSIEEDGFVFVADKYTHQMSFEPLENIHINAKTKSLAYFSAESLGRRVRGFYGKEKTGEMYGEIDFVTPPSAEEIGRD